MAQLISDKRDVEFVIHEQLNTAGLAEHAQYAEFNRKTIDMVLKEVRNLAVKELLPMNAEGDRQGCSLENGNVSVPDAFPKGWNFLKEGEWIAMSEDPDWGGQGMPHTLSSACTEMLSGANMALFMYSALTLGAANLVASFGSESQKERFVRKLYSGEWCGTMLLTEPSAGSDVGALETVAYPQEDGTYKIVGNKIFISGGEHTMADNIIHPVLARIDGEPAGTRGISLFIVPKYRVAADGSMGEFNDVVCTGIEHKMGIHGNSTCSLALGGKDACYGELLGEKNKGMKLMFQMMNEARMFVGIQGLALASSSYCNAVNYARERIQGPNLVKAALEGDTTGVPIIQHPDVRRQLMLMKSHVEGLRSLIYYVGNTFDRKHLATDAELRDKLQGLIEVLIPIAKGYGTDKSFEVCSHGMQVFGGYGFVEEYPQAQLMRDCRITQIYEGTNGIQAMDLLGRKLGMKKGKPFMDLLGEMAATIAEAREIPEIRDLAEGFEGYMNRLGSVAMHMGKTAMSEKVMNAFSFAHPFLEVTGDVTIGWMLLWRAVVASRKLVDGAKDREFYEGQIHSARFFIESVLPVTAGKMDAVTRTSETIMAVPEGAFVS